jgi:hypothetical protein
MAWVRVRGYAQSTEFNGGGGATTAVTIGGAVSVGDTLLLGTTVGADPTTLGASTVTDNLGGNTYTRLLAASGGQQYSSVDNQGWDVWRCIVSTAGTPTITYTPGGGSQQFIGIKGDHFTGSDGASSLRDSKGAHQSHPGTGADAITTASVAAQSGDLQWALVANGDATSTSTAGTGFTGTGADATTGMLTEWKTASGAGAATATDATNGGGDDYAIICQAITPASGAAMPGYDEPWLGTLYTPLPADTLTIVFS